MKKNELNLIVLSMLFGISLVMANVLASTLINTGIPFRGGTIMLPGAVLAYMFTFLFTDVVNELWGKEKANQLVRIGIVGQIFATILIILTSFFPTVSQDTKEAYNIILGQNWIFIIASLTAYVISQSLDVKLFHNIKKLIYKKNEAAHKQRWIWNNLSTMTSQLVDTVIFISIAFGLGFGLSFNEILGMIIGQYCVKFLLALLDTPLFYLMTRKKDRIVN